jgi:hypothetical protein
MTAARTDYSRLIDYIALPDGMKKLQYQVVRFVRGIQGPRTKPVSPVQICKWFSKIPQRFVLEAIFESLMAKQISSKGDFRFAYGFANGFDNPGCLLSILPAGEQLLRARQGAPEPMLTVLSVAEQKALAVLEGWNKECEERRVPVLSINGTVSGQLLMKHLTRALEVPNEP